MNRYGDNDINFSFGGNRGEITNCIECLGVTKPCNTCGILLNWLNGKPIEYGTGQIHRCKGRRYK